MENITGQNNEFTLIFPHNRIDCTSSQNDKFNKIINQANITITGNNNRISMYFDTEESAEELLLSNGFLLIVKGDNNIVNMGTIIGNRVVINGVTLYLQEDDSYVSIGDDSQLSWGIDIWCTDAHTITDLKGEPINFAKCIEIGKHVWIGKDSKIGKNVKIADNSIVGWGSIVTKEFNEPNVIIAGIPAKIVKRGINWDRRCINKYLKERL